MHSSIRLWPCSSGGRGEEPCSVSNPKRTKGTGGVQIRKTEITLKNILVGPLTRCSRRGATSTTGLLRERHRTKQASQKRCVGVYQFVVGRLNPKCTSEKRSRAYR